MSDAISRKIRQLEQQNIKLKKLLESTLEITREDAAKCQALTVEANFLKKAVSDLENQKKQLEEELKPFTNQTPSKNNNNIDIQYKLNDAINDIHRGSSEIEHLKTEDVHLMAAIDDLEKEKEHLLNDIELVKKANNERMNLVQANLKLTQDLAILQAESNPLSCSDQDLIEKLASIENLKDHLEADIRAAQQTPDPLGIPIENTVLELKISGLEKQKERIIKTLKTSLLQSANEISTLYTDTTDKQLRGLLNELDLHKTILMMNLSDIKEMHSEEETKNNNCFEYYSISTPELLICSNPTEILNEITDKIECKSDEFVVQELSTVSEEDEAQQNDLIAEHEQLKQEINRLEGEREELLQKIQNANNLFDNDNLETQNVLPNICVSEEVHQKLPMDDATNQMYVNEEQLLAQRIRELEDDNERIRRDLTNTLIEDNIMEVLQEGERLIRDHNEKN